MEVIVMCFAKESNESCTTDDCSLQQCHCAWLGNLAYLITLHLHVEIKKLMEIEKGRIYILLHL